jgi:predicted PurR-regulated permease PerM
MTETSERQQHSLGEFTKRTIVVAAMIAAVALVCYAAQVFLLAFAGVLVAVFLDFLACKLAAAARITRGKAFAIVASAIALLFALGIWELAPRIADQISDLVHTLPQGFERLRTYLEGREWGRTVLSDVPTMLASADITGRLSDLLSKVVEGVGALIVVAAAGLYLGINPPVYRRGFLRLFPENRRARAAEVLDEVAYTLRWWVLGQLIPMSVLGVLTVIGLKILGMPLAFTLGLFTGVMIFIPYIGALIALAVTVLVALAEGSHTVLYVFLWFIGVHIGEGYFLTPLVQKRAIYLPPGLAILGQVLLGLLVGFLGFALATPLTAAAVVLVKMLYLRERPEHHS